MENINYNDGFQKTPSSITFGQYLKTRRRELGLTQVQVAKKLDVGQNFVAYMENDQRKPSNDVLKRLADCLSLPMDELYLKVHPDVEDIFSNRPQKRERTRFNPLLHKLRYDRTLREKYAITDDDISLLGSIQARGEITRLEDYIFLLMTIRQVFRDKD